MKHTIFSLLAVFVAAFSFVACDDDDSKFKGNDAPIYIAGKDNASANKAVSAEGKMTVHEILTTIPEIVMRAELDELGTTFTSTHSLERANIDTVNDRLVMEAANIIENERLYYLGGIFPRGRNYVLFDGDNADTLGYIPNDVIRAAQVEILDLWKAGKIEEIYERFQDTFYFIPCTGAEFRAQKEDIDWEHEYDDILDEHAETHLITW